MRDCSRLVRRGEISWERTEAYGVARVASLAMTIFINPFLILQSWISLPIPFFLRHCERLVRRSLGEGGSEAISKLR
jgi:hypothetical protein